MQSPGAQIVWRQEPPHSFGGRNLHHVLGVCQERAVHGQGHRHSHALVFSNAIADQHVLERFLRRGHPTEQPSHVAHSHRVVVLDSKRARIVEGTVADQEKHG